MTETVKHQPTPWKINMPEGLDYPPLLIDAEGKTVYLSGRIDKQARGISP